MPSIALFNTNAPALAPEPTLAASVNLARYGAGPMPLIYGLKYMTINLGNLPPKSLTKTNTYWLGLPLEHTRMQKSLYFTQSPTPYLNPLLSTLTASDRADIHPAFECTLAPGPRPEIRGSTVLAVGVREGLTAKSPVITRKVTHLKPPLRTFTA